MPINDLYQYTSCNASFIVKNIISNKAAIRIFNNKILYDKTLDLLKIPGINESIIRSSLLKGDLKYLINKQSIIIIFSDIDLLQFNINQKQFLQNSGILNGLEISNSNVKTSYLLREDIELIGLKNGINRTFYTSEKFLNGILLSGDQMHIKVFHNGRALYEGVDYSITESGGIGTGYDTIYIFSFAPEEQSLLYATYAINNI